MNSIEQSESANRRSPASGGSATELQWHYGPTEADKDSRKMWCYDCGKLVMWIYDDKPDGCYICTGCSRTSDE